jgi:hypothetical protein
MPAVSTTIIDIFNSEISFRFWEVAQNFICLFFVDNL